MEFLFTSRLYHSSILNMGLHVFFPQTTPLLSKLSNFQRLQREHCRTENLIWEYYVSGVLTVF